MAPSPGRNEACRCGSGKKYKHCCGRLGPDGADGAASADAHRLAGLLKAARYQELERAARALIDGNPASGTAWQFLGLALKAQDRDALQALEHAAGLLPRDAIAQNNFGNALSASGRPREAIAAYRRALQLEPKLAEAHNNLGNALLESNEPRAALLCYRGALEIDPDYAAAAAGLAHALRSLGRLEEAVTSYRRALQLTPDSVELLLMLGITLRDLGRLDQAVTSYRRAIEIRPDEVESHRNLAVALRLQGRTAEAEQTCRRALEIDPGSAATLVVLAESSADRGDFEQAERLSWSATAADPDSPEAWATLPRLRKMGARDSSWLAEAQRVASRNLPPRQEVPLRYAIGKYFDDLGEYELAFENFRRANELTKAYRAPHDRRQLTRAVDEILARYDQAWLARALKARRDPPAESERPVFIVGMLRSGTTLAEQILASHPDVFGAGELTFWPNAAPALERGSVDCLPALAADYLRLLEGLSSDARRVIDKMPTNFLHLGLIHAALPRARIIHMRRNPIATCLSIYFQHFETMHSYANDLEDLAHAYTEYERIMRHWRALLPAPALREMCYEELVDSQEASSRTLVEFIGMPWAASCLTFERTDRTVITASKWQVRQKISRGAIERWRHYEKFIGPLRSLG
jgi:tetratricopeptide (TPR) repeat protein